MVGNAVGGQGERYRLRSRAASVSADIQRSEAKKEKRRFLGAAVFYCCRAIWARANERAAARSWATPAVFQFYP
jgi:hypothetical protein